MKKKNIPTMASRVRNNPTFARGLVLHSLEEGLANTITTMGVKEFSKQSGIKTEALSQFVQGKRTFRPKTLDKCLSVFGLPAVFNHRKK